MKRTEVIEKVNEVVKRRHLSPKTKAAYLTRILKFIDFCRANAGLSTEEKITAFLSKMAVKGKVSANTQNQALNAIVFLYRDVLEQPLGDFSNFVRAQKPKTLPVVMSERECMLVLSHVHGIHHLMASLLYGCGLRLNEAVSLRIKDIDFDRDMIFVRHGKGAKDRAVMLPRSVKDKLREQVEDARRIHTKDLAAGNGSTYLPNALVRKFPNAATEFAWQWVFPARKTHYNEELQETKRWHIHHTALQKAVRQAVRLSGIDKKATCHTFRHSFCTHLLESGKGLKEVQELMGHSHVTTTMIYTHVMRKPSEIQSPLDAASNVVPLVANG